MQTRIRLVSSLIIIVISIVMILNYSLVLPTMAYVSTEPHDANAMWLEPSIVELNATEISVGYKFNITVWANSSLDCKGWQFWLIYANTYVNATSAGYTAGTKSEFFQAITTLPINPAFKVDYNATHNRLDFGEAWLMGAFREPGYGSLCWIEFEVTNLPPEDEAVEIPLNIKYAYEPMEPPQTYLLYSDNSKRPLNVSNGLVRFVGEEPPPPFIASCDLSGDPKDSFLPSDPVYIFGNGVPADEEIPIYIFEDVSTWENGALISSLNLTTTALAHSDHEGNIPVTEIWGPHPAIGQYDILADINNNGVYDEGIDALDGMSLIGFLVVPELMWGTISATAAGLAALGIYIYRKRSRLNRLTKPS